MLRYVPVTGALPAAHKTLPICWLLAVPVRLCSEYLLFKQISTEFPVVIGCGSGSPGEPAGIVWFGAAVEDWDGAGVLADGRCTGTAAQAPANNVMADKINKSVFLII
jgi:hypothetical protein